MEETLISLEAAKIAKEKGFYERTSHYYKLDFGGWSKADGIPTKFSTPIEDSKNIFQNCVVSKKGQPHLANAPTQSHLAKWLRDKYYLHPYIVAYFGSEYDEGIQGWELLSIQFLKDEKNLPNRRRFETYEDCLECGLIACLNSID